MSSKLFPPPSSLNARFDQEVENISRQDPSRPAKLLFFDAWRKLKPEYEAMHQALNQYLSGQLQKSSIRATLQSRVKKDDSVSKSIERREEFQGKTYDCPKLILDSIHDLVGFRIIVDYPSGLEQLYHLIEDRFSIRGINNFSRDRGVGVLWKPMFGAYESRNFQVHMSPDQYNSGLSMYYGVLFEIQVTSIAESLYNRLAHPLHYKRVSGTMSRQDEMVIDISHGLSLCYWITIACMEEKLEGNTETTDHKPPLPDTVRMIAGHDPEDAQVDMDALAEETPELPVTPEERSFRRSNIGSSSLKGTAHEDDTVSRDVLLRSLFDLPRENRSNADIWNHIRDKLGLDDETYNKFLKSLTYDRMNDRKNSVQQRHHNTFEWVFRNEKHSTQNRYGRSVQVPSLANWLEEDIAGLDCLYWVSGKPGSGKSFFMKFIEKDGRTEAALQRWQPNCRIISHYLWKLGNDDQSSFKGVVCSLLNQMLRSEKAIALRLLRETPTYRHNNDTSDWDIEDVKKLLFKVLSRSAQSYLVLIDGLDEVSKPHDGMNQVFRLLEDLAKVDRVKVCVSSRPETLFANRFKSRPSLRMQDLTSNDIHKYTIDKLSELSLESDGWKFDEAASRITSRAEGVFLWVYVILKEIQQRVEELDEEWDDILDCISELPSDLMALYRDMLSKLSDNDERYIKKAAIYFQYILEKPKKTETDVAMLSLAADDDLLESFTRPGNTPCVNKWVKLCEKTEKTLFRISAGLLEIKAEEGYLKYTILSDGDRKMMPWMAKSVDFIHKSAIDFLEGEEGKSIFGTYAMGPEDLLMLYVKVKLARHSVTRYDFYPLRSILDIIPKGTDSTSISHDILSLIHACSINKSRGLIHPPVPVSYENFFLFYLAYFCYYKYAEELLKSYGTHNLEASAYVLFGACESKKHLFNDTVDHGERYRVILNILKTHSRAEEHSVEDPSTRQGAIDVIMWAWRAFLLREVERVTSSYHKDTVAPKRPVKDILGMFIKLGVMTEVPGPKYLVARVPGYIGFRFVRDSEHRKSHLGYKSFWSQCPSYKKQTHYVEVNDAWLVHRLYEAYSKEGAQDVVKDDPFMRILLADYGSELCEANFFFITKNESTEEATVNSLRELDAIDALLLKESSQLKVSALGKFGHVIPVLKKINYDLPDVNKNHICLYEWIGVP